MWTTPRQLSPVPPLTEESCPLAGYTPPTGIYKGSGRAFLGDEQVQDPEWWSEEDFPWWIKGHKNKTGLSIGNDGSQKDSFRTYLRDKGAGNDHSQNKGKGKSQKVKGKKEAHPRSGLSASETPEEEGYSHSWESDDWSSSQWPDDYWTPAAGWYCARDHTAWVAVLPLNLAYHPTHVVLDLGCTRSIGSRSRSVIQQIPETCMVFWHHNGILPI